MSVSERRVGLPLAEISHPDIKRILVLPDREMAASEAAGIIVDMVRDNPGAAISYATGETMIPVYAAVARMVAENGISFAATTAFRLDEYWPADPERDSWSFVCYLRERVFGPLGIRQVFEINGLVSDPKAEARRYDGLLGQFPVDLAILGIGPGGHIAFNERGSRFYERTRVVKLAYETLTRDRQERGQTTPEWAITQGIANIWQAKQILLVAYGEKKGGWLREALYGSVNRVCPASALRLVGEKVTIIIDQEAGEVITISR